MSRVAVSDPPDCDDQSGAVGNLLNQASRSLKWAFLANAAPRVVTPFSNMILAALLTPVDFGIVAIATLVIALARILVDMGLGKAVVQRQTRVEEAASVSLWLSLSVSAGMYGVLWITAPWIAEAFGTTGATDVIRASGLFLPLSAAASIPTALLQRNMEFRRLLWVNSSFLIIQAVVSVCLALAGVGYWALVLGQLVGMSISAGLAWGLARWRPGLIFTRLILRPILGFGVWVIISGFQNWLFLYADNAIAGLFLGVQGLGIYSLAFSVSTLIPGFFVAAVGDVAYPTFCRLQESPRTVGYSLLKLQMLIGAVLFPVSFGISAIAQPAVSLLYGNRWPGLGAIIGFLAIMPGLSPIWSLNGKAYQAIGRPDVWTKLCGLNLLILLPLLWVAAPYGLPTFTLTRFWGAMLIPIVNMVVAARVLGISLREQIETFVSPLCIGAMMFAVVIGFTRLMEPFEGMIGWAKLLSIIAIGALVYILLLKQTNRGLWDQLLLSLRRVVYR